MSKLKELVDKLAAAGVHSATVYASGSGDEGMIETMQVFFEEDDPTKGQEPRAAELAGDLEDLVDDVFAEHDFDYYNGDGGSLELHIDVAARTCQWEAYTMAPVLVEDFSQENTV